MGCKDREVFKGQPGFSRSKKVKEHSEQRMRIQRTLLVTDLEFYETPEKEGARRGSGKRRESTE